MTEQPRGLYGSMMHGYRRLRGSYCAWCRKELPDPQESKVNRYCDEQCRQADERSRHDQTPVTRGELERELQALRNRLDALERRD